MVWENPYRDEFTRHGEVSHPTYPKRESVDVSFEGGTWSGQADRQLQTETTTGG
jgi:hypothetical protein